MFRERGDVVVGGLVRWLGRCLLGIWLLSFSFLFGWAKVWVSLGGEMLVEIAVVEV